jgi:transposase-like protein
MIEPPAKARVGRPRSQVLPEAVRQLRDQGTSWRTIGRTLGIGTATAQRAYNAISRSVEASQNSGPSFEA